MYALEITPSSTITPTSRRRSAARWMATFAGFPVGGYTAYLLSGPVNTLTAALVGGLITGLVLGAAQSWGIGRNGPPALQWIAATAIGLMLGLGIGAVSVGYDTTITALVIQGAICGFAVGTAQALVLRPQLGRLALAWPPALAAIWALGWAVTTSAGIQVDEQFTVFGSSGALVVTALTAVLPVVINSRRSSRS
ncbi:MAG: hypothetical protein QOE89_1851 [Pseudonocardiales bacterium]|jgi:hypothetical protein|nr:hypothetical protein [Pseudonocardiales bacterium]